MGLAQKPAKVDFPLEVIGQQNGQVASRIRRLFSQFLEEHSYYSAFVSVGCLAEVALATLFLTEFPDALWMLRRPIPR